MSEYFECLEQLCELLLLREDLIKFRSFISCFRRFWTFSKISCAGSTKFQAVKICESSDITGKHSPSPQTLWFHKVVLMNYNFSKKVHVAWLQSHKKLFAMLTLLWYAGETSAWDSWMRAIVKSFMEHVTFPYCIQQTRLFIFVGYETFHINSHERCKMKSRSCCSQNFHCYIQRRRTNNED